jgi:hypothetical protein
MFSPQSTAQKIADLQRSRAESAQRSRLEWAGLLPTVAEVALGTSSPPPISKAPSPIVAQRYEPPQADASQLLVASQLPGLSTLPSPARPRRKVIVEEGQLQIAPSAMKQKGTKRIGAAVAAPSLSINA